MLISCEKCETMFDDKKYDICPKCDQEELYELGLKISSYNKKQRESK